MSGSLAALFPVSITGISGFVFLRFWVATRSLHRLEPAGLYAFWVGVASLALLFVSVVVILVLDQAWLQFDCRLWSNSSCELKFSISALQPSITQWGWAAALSLPLAAVLVVALHSKSLSERALLNIFLQDLKGTALGRLAIASADRDPSLPIALTLETGHVIIGYPISPESFANSSADVDILPFASGFRDDRHRLHLSTNYRWIYKLSRSKQETFIKAIGRNRIVSANLFDEKKWLAFKKTGSDLEKKSDEPI